MYQEFSNYFDVDLVCYLRNEKPEKNSNEYLFKAEFFKINSIFGLSYRFGKSIYINFILNLFDFLSLAYKIFKNRDKWNYVWLTDFTLLTHLCYCICIMLDIPVIFYIRGDVEKEILSKERNFFKKIIAHLYILYIRVFLLKSLKQSCAVLAGKDLYDKYRKKNIKKIFHITATSICERDLLEKKNITNQPKTKKILYVGNLFPYKGLDILLKAVGVIDGSINFVLDIVGDGPEKQKLKTMAIDLGLGDVVVFHGIIKNKLSLETLYANSDVFVLPSYTEGTPKVLTEALSKSVPVVASKVGGIPHMIKDGVNGFLVDPGDFETLNKKIVMLLENSEVRQIMSINALNSAKAYTIECQLEGLKKYLEHIE